MKEIGQRILKDAKLFWPIPIIVGVIYVVVNKIEGAFCPSVIVLGLPCAGCGLTRAGIYVLQGRFIDAFYMNPTIYLWILFLLYIIIVRYILGKPLKHLTTIVAVLGIVMMVRFLIGMYLYYPDRPPFSYTGGNTLEGMIPGYRQMVRDFELPW